jgi:ATP-dependent helicase/nuclease subunit A
MSNKPAFTTEQRAAIDVRDGNFLVAAGAGSGKTKVLTQRVHDLRLPKPGEKGVSDMGEMLVLTFTKKAADEMKSRVVGLFEDDASDEAKKAIEELSGAYIMTFDAFARAVVSSYHHELGIPGEIDIADANLLAVMEKEIVVSKLNELYEADDPALKSFRERYLVTDDDKLVDAVSAVLRAAELSGDKDGFLAGYEERFLSKGAEERIKAELFGRMRDLLAQGLTIAESLSGEAFGDKAALTANTFSSLLECPDFDSLLQAILATSYPRRPKTDDAAAVEAWDAAKGFFSEALSLVKGTEPIGRWMDDVREGSLFVVSLARSVDEELSRRKRLAGVYSFADVAALATKAVRMEEVGDALRRRFRYIMIDEYQDTSDLQERFIDALAGDNVFQVGDIKQSIYRFRNANPDLFADKAERYSKGQDGTLLRLSVNFRSREGVIDDINAVFSKLMSKELGGVDYGSGEALRFGRAKDFSLTEAEEDRHSEVYEYKRPEATADIARAEASIIANDILDKVGRYRLQGKGGSRPASYGDFAILARTKSDFDVYRDVFKEARIPLAIEDEKDATTEQVAMVYERIMKLIDCIDKEGPLAEKERRHCFCSIARSYLFMMGDADILAAVRDGSYAEAPFMKMVKDGKDALMSMSLEGIARWAIDSFGIKAKLTNLGDVKLNYQAISTILDEARVLDRFSYSFADYLQYFEDRAAFGFAMSYEVPNPTVESVRLMSIHKSKGLEFPVVYLPSLCHNGKKGGAGFFTASKDFGLLLPGSEDGRPRSPVHAYAEEREEAAARSEAMRLFYVAMTRAEEKVIFLMPTTKKNADGKDTGLGEFEGYVREAFDNSAFVKIGKPPLKPNVAKSAPASAQKPTHAPIGFRQIQRFGKPYLAKRPSKLTYDLPDPGALREGNRLHRLMELTDIATKDVSWIEDKSDRDIVAKALDHAIFKDASQAEAIMKEYGFVDPDTGIEGTIDLLMVFNNKCVVVDYKSTDIYDPAYVRQVQAYVSYVERTFGLRTKGYLLSLKKGVVKAV